MFRIILVVMCVVGLSAALGMETLLDAAGHADAAPMSTVPAGTVGGVPSSNPAAPAVEEEGFGSSGIIMLVLMLGFMYFVLIRPQSKEQKRRKTMMNDIKIGDNIVTIGGMHGVIERKGEEDVDVRVKDGSIITFNLSAVSQRINDNDKTSTKDTVMTKDS